jgi:phage head maturation protease
VAPKTGASIRLQKLVRPVAPTSSSSPRPQGVDLDPLRTRRTAVALQYAEVTKSAKSGRPRYVISTEHVDLQGDIVVQAGLTPVSDRIPAQVDHSGKMRDVIGWWDHIETQGKRTLADLVLFEPGLTPIADMVRAMHDAGVRMASSIGFVPDFEDGGYELIRDGSNDYITGIKYLRSKLIETSVVVVPANPGALSTKQLEAVKRFGFDDAHKFSRFVMSDASQQVLRTMPRHDALARAAAAVQKANAALQRSQP